ncbi:RHS repeat-associated core domain-containing protein [Chitinophaga varians]|uniref:RHS repeat-associated core domain-containing protein n=1 Tax=Chitinophaga varians TaxID=2202339 RepID=A0A847RK16_9BACT|nr:RHS repeat-associated core domain-containing protein [Chitinophaga varians]NLR63312.1 RHS repeat-associated core domain-containing protein [Chitinophaga varians]
MTRKLFLLICLPLLLLTGVSLGQNNLEIYGPTTVKVGEKVMYSAVLHAYDPNNPNPDYCWSVTGGNYQIVNDGCRPVGQPARICEKCTNIEVTWTGSGTGNVQVSTENGYSANLSVTIVTPIILQQITPVLQYIKYNTIPVTLTQTTPSGGNGIFTYQWQKLNSEFEWENISGATAISYTPAALTKNMKYRVMVTSYDASVFSREAEVVVRRPLQPGEIYGYQVTSPNTRPRTIKGEPASGDEGRFVYQWEESADRNTWTNITGATQLHYSPPVITATRYYRRKVTSTYGSSTSNAYTQIATVAVNDGQSANTPVSNAAAYTQPEIRLNDLGPNAITAYNSNIITEANLLKPGVNTDADISALAPKDAAIQKVWYDGIGRPLQQVSVKTDALKKDLVYPIAYDDLGRSREVFLPYIDSTSSGALKTNAGTGQWNFYKKMFPTENFFYNKRVNDAQGNNLQDATAGNSWMGSNAGTSGYVRAMLPGEQVWRWVMINDTTPALAAGAQRLYDTTEITVNESLDIDGRLSISYLDRQGKVIMSKAQYDENSQIWLCSYNVYDDFGQTRYTIPPKAISWIQANYSSIPTATVWPLNTDIKRNLCTAYQFDDKGRNTVRKDAGIDDIWMVYDKKNRPVLTQTPGQRLTGKWNYRVYDKRGRVVVSGLYASAATRQQLQDQIDQAAIRNGSTITINKPAPVDLIVSRYDGASSYIAKNSVALEDGFSTPDNTEILIQTDPALQDQQIVSRTEVDEDYLGLSNCSSCTPLNINYYDNYDFPGASERAFNTTYIDKVNSGSGLPKPVKSQRTDGLITGSRIKVLYPSGVSGPEWLTSVTYYDDRGRIIQAHVDNILGGTDVESVQFDFTSQVISTHKINNNPWGKPQKTLETRLRNVYYDDGKLKEKWLAVNNQPEKRLEDYYYNDLGQITRKVLGNGIETLNYTYNLKGWLTGINADYADNKTNPHFFGTRIAFNEGFRRSQLGGKASGVIWRRAGSPDEAMGYGYDYDIANRLKTAHFIRNTGGSSGEWSQQEKNYTVDNLRYDEGGNIMSMRSYATLLGNTKAVDDLTYTYQPDSYVLSRVTDAAGDNKQSDFKNGNTTTDQYTYNKDGNLISDANKGVAMTWNNVIEKPDVLTFGGDANKTIKYVYDASGYRWQKIVKEGNALTTYTYIGNIVYKNDSILLHFGHSAGRIRMVTSSTTNQTSFCNDYFLTDQIGNIRTVITDQKDTAVYNASMEPARDAVENAIFSNRDGTKETIPATYPFYNANTNRFWSKLNGSDVNKRIGPSLVLKVMAGDTIDVGTRAFYKTMSPSNTGTPVNDMVSALLNAMLGSQGTAVDGGHGNLVQGNNTIINKTDFSTFIQTTQQQNNTQGTAPKAYLNYLLFDEDFKMVSGQVLRINKGADVMQEYVGQITVPKNGFLYVYTSNESVTDVWFDDLMVVHRSGPLIQENTLYPYGLSIASQSSSAPMRTANNNLYQAKELDGEMGLNMYYFDYRYYDPQLGRFISIDPGRQFANGYQGMGNNPAMFVDPDGRFVWFVVAIGAAFGAFSGYSVAKAKGAKGFWEWFGYIGAGAVIGGASAGAGSAIGSAAGAVLTNATGTIAHAGLFASAIGGAVGGGLSGLGFSALSGSENIWGAVGTGMLTGAIGGAAGSYIGGGGGALVSGFASGTIGNALGGGDFGSILKAGLIGAATSWGVYQLSTSINYKAYSKLTDPGAKLTRKQFAIISKLVQRSFARGKEYGGFVNADGTVTWSKGGKSTMTGYEEARHADAKFSFHTHPNNGHSWVHEHSGTHPVTSYSMGKTLYQGDIQVDKIDGLNSLVISRSNVFYHDLMPTDFNPLNDLSNVSQNLMPNRVFNPYPYNTFPVY